jgi:acyl-CoA thioesterase-2
VGNCRHDLQYNVSSLRAGRQSSVIQVQTHQNNRFLFQVMASFTKGNPQLHHTPSMPNVPSPMDLNDDHEMLCDLLKTFPHSRGLRNFVSRRTNSDTCLDIKPIEPQNFLHSSENTSARRLWFRMRTSLPEELSTILLSYTSDFLLVGISLQPHNLSILHPTLKFVSLDHSMWFYDSFPRNSWILLEANSEVYAHGRCLVQGNFFREDGTLIARCSQEGLIHIRQRGAQ